MTDKANQRSWKNFLVRKDVQWPIIRANLVFLIIVTAVLITVLLSPLYYDMLNAEDLWVQNASGKLFLILLRRITLAMLMIMILATVHQIVMSHRFCGPLVNLGHTFEKMVQGDFSRKVYLRKKDFLKPEANQVNAIIDRLTAERESLNENMDAMAATLAKLELQPTATETADLIGQLRTSLNSCRTRLGELDHSIDA